jgi:hypothetical protein
MGKTQNIERFLWRIKMRRFEGNPIKTLKKQPMGVEMPGKTLLDSFYLDY